MPHKRTSILVPLLAAIVCIAFAVSMSAQVQTTTTTTAHPSSVTTTVERAEVVSVQGNDLVVKMEDGSLRHIANVPASARATVDGKQIGIADVKPGMKLQKTITTTTTPKTITTVQTVTGKVWHVNPPNVVILTLEDNTNQQFKIPKGQKFKVNGEMVDAFGLRKGMKIDATKIVEEPVVEQGQAVHVSGTLPPDAPIMVAVGKPTPTPAAGTTESAAANAPAASLPKTAGWLPLIGLLGGLMITSGFLLRAVRKLY